MPAPFFVKEIRQLLAVAYLRLGEQENCLLNHGHESCIYPLRKQGQHQLKRGSTGAIRELSLLLSEDPNDHSARWLLNLAHMTLGEHPQRVPSQWLIPTERFNSEYDIKRFTDIAPKLGLDVSGRAGGSVMEDFDGDDLLDLMISSSGPLDQLRFFRNQGDGTFVERTKEAGLTGVTGGLNLIHGDYNNDNWPDVLVLRGGWWSRTREVSAVAAA
ncbi:MAG: VCBS repeat-containing protein [Pyrinomonadaceae bacterium]